MKKNIIIFIGIILICQLFSGCSKIVTSDNKITKLEEENQELKKELQNAKEEIKRTREGNSLRFELEYKFYNILRLLEKGEVEELKTLATDNIIVKNHKIINQDGCKREFSIIPKGTTYYIPRCFLASENEFFLAYEILNDNSFDYYNGIEAVLNVRFKCINGKWKLDNIEIDGWGETKDEK